MPKVCSSIAPGRPRRRMGSQDYQSTLMSDKLVIPKGAFTCLVREILQAQLRREWGPEHMMRQPDWHIEEDALICLQTMSEHIIVMMMEMW